MTYKGYEIDAEVQSYDKWSLDDNGQLEDWLTDLDGIEIVAYHADNDIFDTLQEAKEHIDELGPQS